MRYIGIDVSKTTFMVAYPLNEEEYKTREFKNTVKGIHEFIRTEILETLETFAKKIRPIRLICGRIIVG